MQGNCCFHGDRYKGLLWNSQFLRKAGENALPRQLGNTRSCCCSVVQAGFEPTVLCSCFVLLSAGIKGMLVTSCPSSEHITLNPANLKSFTEKSRHQVRISCLSFQDSSHFTGKQSKRNTKPHPAAGSTPAAQNSTEEIDRLFCSLTGLSGGFPPLGFLLIWVLAPFMPYPHVSASMFPRRRTSVLFLDPVLFASACKVR